MPARLISLESSCLLQVHAAEGIPDPPQNLGGSCPWVLHPEEQLTRASQRPSKVAPTNVAEHLAAEQYSHFPSIKTPSVMNMLHPPISAVEFAFNEHEALHSAEDQPDVLLLHQGVLDQVIDSLVRLEATCSVLEASSCRMRDLQRGPACKPPQVCLSRVCGEGTVKETLDEMFIGPSPRSDEVEPMLTDRSSDCVVLSLVV